MPNPKIRVDFIATTADGRPLTVVFRRSVVGDLLSFVIKRTCSHWTERLCRGTRADGRPAVLRLRMRAIVDGAGRPAGTVAVFSEASLQESLQKKLAAYERLASLGELATSLVHEVGNPVAVILGFASLLIQEEGRDPGGELPERIYREAERCREIVGQLLEYARSSRYSPRPIPLNVGDVARETVQLLGYRMKRQGVRCGLEWETGAPLVEADPGEMKQVLLNVLLNAVEAMGQGGTVTVSGRRIERETTVAAEPKPAEPKTVLQTPQTAGDADAERRVREVLGRARRELGQVNAATLGSDARTQYETARRFIDQAEDALKARNYMFARYLADKADALARGLTGR